MRYLICVMLLCGCGPGRFTNISSSEPKDAAKPPEFTVTVQDKILSKQDETLSALAAIKSQVESLNSSILETRQAVGTMEAKLIVPKPQREEVIKSAVESQEPTRANQSQSTIPVALSPAVRSSSVVMKWDIEGNKNPSILETAKHLREDHGVNVNGLNHQQLHDLHAALHEGRKAANKSQPVQFVNRGSQCPGGVCPSPRRGLFGRRR